MESALLNPDGPRVQRLPVGSRMKVHMFFTKRSAAGLSRLSISFVGAMVFLFSGIVAAKSGVLRPALLAVQRAVGYQSIYVFSGYGGQGKPDAPLVSDGHGGFYGVGKGGPYQGYGPGSVFQLHPPTPQVPRWTQQTLFEFNGSNGYGPNQLLVGQDGNLYGTASGGGDTPENCVTLTGCGVVYRLKPPTVPGGVWTEETVHSFTGTTDGAVPQSELLEGPGGVFYGTTSGGGYTKKEGTVFAIYPPGDPRGRPGTRMLVTLYTFAFGVNRPAGYGPIGGLVMDSSGALYGTTTQGGNSSDDGAVFKLIPSAKPPWNLQVLHEFTPSDGGTTQYTLVAGPGGSLYGSTSYPCVVYQLTPPAVAGKPWNVHDLKRFASYGESSRLITDATGALYGTAMSGYRNGALIDYKLTPGNGTWSETVLHAFPPTVNYLPGLVEDSGGMLYGSTYTGGGAGAGSIYTLSQ